VRCRTNLATSEQAHSTRRGRPLSIPELTLRVVPDVTGKWSETGESNPVHVSPSHGCFRNTCLRLWGDRRESNSRGLVHSQPPEPLGHGHTWWVSPETRTWSDVRDSNSLLWVGGPGHSLYTNIARAAKGAGFYLGAWYPLSELNRHCLIQNQESWPLNEAGLVDRLTAALVRSRADKYGAPDSVMFWSALGIQMHVFGATDRNRTRAGRFPRAKPSQHGRH
jgi:hypothetical protein